MSTPSTQEQEPCYNGVKGPEAPRQMKRADHQLAYQAGPRDHGPGCAAACQPPARAPSPTTRALNRTCSLARALICCSRPACAASRFAFLVLCCPVAAKRSEVRAPFAFTEASSWSRPNYASWWSGAFWPQVPGSSSRVKRVVGAQKEFRIFNSLPFAPFAERRIPIH